MSNITADKVVITATNVTVGKEPETPARLPGYYHVNAFLLAGLMTAATVWFSIHLQSYIAQTLVLGTVTVFTVWKALHGFLKKDYEKPGEELRKRLLTSPDARENLLLAAAVVAFAYLTTSSIYLKHDGSGADKAVVEVVDSSGVAFMPPLTVSKDERTSGRPKLLRLSRKKLTFRVREPRGYLPKTFTVYPWNRLDLTFPGSFDPKRFHLLRVVPGLTLRDDLSYPGVKSSADPAVLRVRVRGQECAIPDHRLRVAVIGAGAEDLPGLVKKHSDEQFRSELAAYARDMRREKREDLITMLQHDPHLLPTIELRPGETVEVTLTRQGKTIASQTVRVPENELTTIYLEKQQTP